MAKRSSPAQGGRYKDQIYNQWIEGYQRDKQGDRTGLPPMPKPKPEPEQGES